MRAITRAVIHHGVIWGASAAALAVNISALAQLPQPIDSNQRQVYLVRKDQSDCTNSDVPNVNSPLVAGNIWVTRLHDGNTSVKVALTAKPNTTYRFFLKCVRPLADITTDDEGIANVAFAFPSNLAGAVRSEERRVGKDCGSRCGRYQ